MARNTLDRRLFNPPTPPAPLRNSQEPPRGLEALRLEALLRQAEGYGGGDTGPRMPSGPALMAAGASLMAGGRNPYGTTSGVFSEMGAALAAANAVQARESAIEAKQIESRKTRRAANVRAIWKDQARAKEKLEARTAASLKETRTANQKIRKGIADAASTEANEELWLVDRESEIHGWETSIEDLQRIYKMAQMDKEARVKAKVGAEEISKIYTDIINSGEEVISAKVEKYVQRLPGGLSDPGLDVKYLRKALRKIKVGQKKDTEGKERLKRYNVLAKTIRDSGSPEDIKILTQAIMDFGKKGLLGFDEENLQLLASNAAGVGAELKAMRTLQGSDSVANLIKQRDQFKEGSKKWILLNKRLSLKVNRANKFMGVDDKGNVIILEGPLASKWLTNLVKSRTQTKVFQGERIILELYDFYDNHMKEHYFGARGQFTAFLNSISQFLPFLYDEGFTKSRVHMGAVQEKGIALMRAFPGKRMLPVYVDTIKKLFPTDTPFKGGRDAETRVQALIEIFRERTMFAQGKLDPSVKSIVDPETTIHDILKRVRDKKISYGVGLQFLRIHPEFRKGR